jgi:phosphatidylglycerophosphatase A
MLSKGPMLRKITIAISTGLGTGYSPVAPGTAGSVLGLAIAFLFTYGCRGLGVYGGTGYFALMAALFVVGVWASGRAEAIFGQKDSSKIVIDEVVGMLLTLYLLPASLFYLITGFFIFRFFDIVKPFPARRIDTKLEGGLGVMLDDVVAAIYANLCLQGVKYLKAVLS